MKFITTLILGLLLAGETLVFGLEPCVFVVKAGSNTVSMVDPVTLKVVRNIAVSNRPIRLKLLPDGSKLYVATQTSLNVIDTTTFSVVAVIPVDTRSSEMETSLDGTRLFVDLHGMLWVGAEGK